MDKRMQLLGKIGTILADFIGIILMLMALAFAFARENPLVFVTLAALACPLWYKVVQKYWFREKPLVSALVRAAILIGGYLLLTQAIKWNPYNRCYDSVARDRFRQHFEKLHPEGDYELGEIGTIAEKKMWDYLKLIAPVSYTDASGTQGSQDVTLYFDRLDGKFYESFDAMREYRKEYRQKYKQNSFRNRQFFDDEKLDATVSELNTFLLGNQYDAMTGKMEDGFRKKVTAEYWRSWQSKIVTLGAFQKQEVPLEKTWLVTKDENHAQTMEVNETLVFAEGRLAIKMLFRDDLTLLNVEIK